MDGQPLEYYGRRQVPCDIELQDGTIDMALLRPEVCNVSKLIISVSSLSDNGIGSWIPPDDGRRYWLRRDDGEEVELTGPALINKMKLAPIARRNGVYWLPVKVRNPGARSRFSPAPLSLIHI